MSVHINDLPNEILCHLFEFLPKKNLFQIEIVCQKWKYCVRKLLLEIEVLEDIVYWKNDAGEYKDAPNLESILVKCQNINKLCLGHTTLENNSLVTIAKLCPQLEQINFCFTADLRCSDDELEEFGKLIGTQLKYCNLFFLEDDRLITIFLKHLTYVEEIKFYIYAQKIRQIKELFFNLNDSCDQLKTLEWLPFGISPMKRCIFTDENFIQVHQKINHLSINLYHLYYFQQIDLSNLTELTLSGEDYKFDFSDITFKNVTKLTLMKFNDNIFKLGKIKFPKLEILITNFKQYVHVPSSFYHEFERIKTFHSKSNLLNNSEEIFQLKQLIDIQLDIEYACPKVKDVHIMNCIDALVKHSSLRNIKLCIYDLPYERLEIFDKLVQLNQLKPNVQIEILIHDWPSERQKVLEKRKKFWEIKQKTNLNMKFCLYTD